VLAIRPKDNTVLVGPRELLAADLVRGDRVVWTRGAAPGVEFACAVQLRAHGMTSSARVTVDGTQVSAALTEAQQGVAAGQAMVMYDGDEVLGSATITAADRAPAGV
jgi:tRNA-specific 2-thiouridylase